MTAWLISCAVYGACAYVVIRTHDAERLTPRWLRRFGRSLLRAARTVRTRIARVLAALRLGGSLLSFSLHHLQTPKGVSHR